MGERLQEAAALYSSLHVQTYARKDVMFVAGEGMRLFDDEGREYLDFVSGLGVVNLGHSHPEVTLAVREQIGRLAHVSNLFYVEHQGEFLEAILEMVGSNLGGRLAGARVFLCNSGTEATEGAVKFARKWGRDVRGPDCFEVVTALRSFHGRTLAALAATGQPAKHEPFAPMPSGFSHVPLNHIAALEAAIGPGTCAVMLEPIQGEGGVYEADPAYLQQVRALCDERRVLLIMDEVQTGCWRTGSPLAHQRAGMEADIVTMAKALANGLPAGAVVASEEVASALGYGDHGSTFAGGPVVCAAGVATLRALRRERLGENAARVGAYAKERLGRLAGDGLPVKEVRGQGLMLGVELDGVSAARVVDSALASGIVLNNIGDSIVRMLPPLCCTEEDVDAALDVLAECIERATGGE